MTARLGPVGWALVLAIGLAALCASALQARRFNEPPEVVNAIVVRLDAPGQRRDDTFAFHLADGQVFYWWCAAAVCAPSREALRKLRWETPMPAEFQIANDQIVGLSIREAEVIDPAVDVGRRTARLLPAFAFEAGMAAVGAGGLYLRLRGHKPVRRQRKRKAA